jgi:hypothetical protein
MNRVADVEVVELSDGLSHARILTVTRVGAPALLAWLLGLRWSLYPVLRVSWKGVGETALRVDESLPTHVSVDPSADSWMVAFSITELDRWIEFLVRFSVDLPLTDHIDVDASEGDREFQLVLRGDFRMPGGSPSEARRAMGLD